MIATRTGTLLGLTLTLGLGLACSGLVGSSPYKDADLAGVWQEESGATTTISMQGSQAVVSSIVDSDGEVFEVRSSGWEAGAYTWTYFVPSTSYVVTIDVTSLDGDMMQTTWNNSFAEGEEALFRMK